MIQRFELKPTTKDSHPFARAAIKCCFDQRAYVEEEYFFYGTSNVYAENDDLSASVIVADAPYINRLLVRRPKDRRNASGRVVIESLNATTTMDIDRVWMLTKEELMRNGDVYIGFSSKPAVLKLLKKFDHARYCELAWTNPRAELPVPTKNIVASRFMGELEQHSEYGLLWDMITDLATSVRNSSLPLDGIKVKYVYLTGWSQSSWITFRYAVTFAKRTNAFDGYMAAGGGCYKWMLTPLNQYEPSKRDSEDPFEPCPLSCDVPFIAVQTECENCQFAFRDYPTLIMGSMPVAKLDSDEPGNLYRIYDIPGSTHDNKYNMVDYYENDEDVHKVGFIPGYSGLQPYPSDYPYEFAFDAIMHQLYQWAEQRIPAIKVPRIQVDCCLRNVRDGGGNAVGGWRLPFVDVPYATYLPEADPIKRGAGSTKLFGCRIPYSAEKLSTLYGTLAHYRQLVENRTDELVERGMVLPAERDACVELAVKRARKGGLT